MKSRAIVFVLSMAAALAGCSAPSHSFGSASYGSESASSVRRRALNANAAEVEPSNEPPPPPSEAQGASASAEFGSQDGRAMAYTAMLHMNVDNSRAAFSIAAALTAEAGGYVQESHNLGGVLRVPVGKADAVLAQIEQLGTVLERRIVGSDVTDSHADAEIRLSNLRTMRERLAALLEKAEKVEDALKIEQEMTRVVTDIERLEGVLARLKNQINFVTLTLAFNQNVPQPAPPKLPVPWVNELGATSPDQIPRPNSAKKLPYKIELPNGFAVLGSRAYESAYDGRLRQLHAISADDCALRLSRRSALEGSSFEFWRSLARRSLREVNSIQLAADEAVRIGGETAALFEGARAHGNSYLLLLLMFRDEVYLFEFWGPAAAFETHLEAVRASYNSIRVGRWK